MMNYDNTNKVVIFKNDQKGNEKAPSYKGSINVEGKDYEISLWVKESEKTGKYFQGSIQVKQPKESASNTPQNANEDDLPF
jgi:hypothetical protein